MLFLFFVSCFCSSLFLTFLCVSWLPLHSVLFCLFFAIFAFDVAISDYTLYRFVSYHGAVLFVFSFAVFLFFGENLVDCFFKRFLLSLFANIFFMIELGLVIRL